MKSRLFNLLKWKAWTLVAGVIVSAGMAENAMASVADMSTLTVGFALSGCPSACTSQYGYGFGSGGQYYVPGSMSPSVLSNGQPIVNLSTYTNQVQDYVNITIGGFSSSPGKGWLVSVSVNGHTLQGGTASYTYSAGRAYWTWTPSFSLGAISSQQTVVITHN